MRNWYRIEAQAARSVRDIYIYDAIGSADGQEAAVSAKQLVDELNALPDEVRTIRVHVNSPGGSVFEAESIAVALRAQREAKQRDVEVSIEGLAASAATIVTSAGRPIRMSEHALFMVHDPRALAYGTEHDMTEMASVLRRVRDSIVSIYQWVSKKSADDLRAMMLATTWMDAHEALAAGFVTEVVAGPAPQAVAFQPAIVASLGAVPAPYVAAARRLFTSPTGRHAASSARSTPSSQPRVTPRPSPSIDIRAVYRQLNAPATSPTRGAPEPDSLSLAAIASRIYAEDAGAAVPAELIAFSQRGGV